MLKGLTRSHSRILLLLILGTGLFFRLNQLSSESLWVDETYTLRIAELDLAGVFANVDVHPPLYYTIMHFWVKAFGTSEVALRSISVLFGLATLWVVYRLGRRLFGRSAALAAVTLMAFSSFHVMYSQEGRSYTFLTLVGAASYYFFVRLRQKPRFHVIAGYMLSSLALLYTHNFGALVLISQNAYVACLWISRPKGQKPPLTRWVALQVILFVLFVPWVLSSLGYSKTVGKNFWIDPPTPRMLLYTLREYVGGFKTLAAAVLTLALAIPAWRGDRLEQRRNVWLLAGWLIVSLAVPYAISVLWTPIFYTRYTIISSIPFYLLIGYAAANVRPRILAGALLVLLTALSTAGVLEYYAEQKKEDWKGAAAFLDASTRPGDVLLFHLSGKDVYEYYSSKEDTIQSHRFPFRAAIAVVAEESKRVTPDNIGTLPDFIQGSSRVWLVLSHSRDKDGLLSQGMTDLGYRRTKERVFAPQGVEPRSTADARVIELALYER